MDPAWQQLANGGPPCDGWAELAADVVEGHAPAGHVPQGEWAELASAAVEWQELAQEGLGSASPAAGADADAGSAASGAADVAGARAAVADAGAAAGAPACHRQASRALLRALLAACDQALVDIGMVQDQGHEGAAAAMLADGTADVSDEDEDAEEASARLAVGAPAAGVGSAVVAAAAGPRAWPEANAAVHRQACGEQVLSGCLEVVSALSEDPQVFAEVADAAATRILDDLMKVAGARVSSDAAVAERLQVSRRKLRARRDRFACAAVLIQRAACLELVDCCVRQVKAQGGRCMLLSEHPRFDETPMLSRVKDADLCFDLGRGRMSAGVGEAPPVVALPLCESAVQKILATEWKYGMLFKLDGHYICITWCLVCPVQVMSRATAETYSRCLKVSGLDLSRFYPEFQRVQRVACSDGDLAVAKSERHFAALLSEQAHCLHTVCVVHRAAAMKASMLDLWKPLVQEVTHTVLSLRAARGMSSFRRVFKAVVMRSVHIFRDVPPDPSLRRAREAMLDSFLPPGELQHHLRRHTILSLANGDWTKTDRVEHYAYCSPLSDLEIKAAFGSSFVRAMVGCGPKSFPSRNWVGAEDAPAWLGVLQAVHGLLRRVYVEWAEDGGGAAGVLAAGGVPAAVGREPLGAPVALAALQDVPRDGHGVDGGEGDVVKAAPGAAIGECPVQQRRQEQAQYRATSLRWLRSGRCVLSEMLVLRICLEPHRGYVARLLFQAGGEWQQQAHVRYLRRSASEGAGGALPEYRLLSAHQGTAETLALAGFHELLVTRARWQAVPRHARTKALQTMAFIMLSRSACRAYRIKALHEGYPFRVFGLLGGDSERVLQQIQTDPPCVLDHWSRAVVAHFGAELGGEDARADLAATASLAREETVDIENGHASLRRTLLARSVQSKRVDVVALNTDTVARQLRREQALIQGRRRPAGVAAAVASAAEPHSGGACVGVRERQRQRSWCAWTLFCSEQRRGSAAADFSQIAQAYRSLDDARLAELRQRAAELKRLGVTCPVGESARKRRALGDARLRASVVHEMSTVPLPAGPRAGTAPGASVTYPGVASAGGAGAKPCAGAHEGVQQACVLQSLPAVPWGDIQRAKLQERLVRERQREARRGQQMALEAFAREGLGTEVLEAASRAVPSPALADSWPWPGPGTSHCVQWSVPSLVEKATRAASLSVQAVAARRWYAALDCCWGNAGVAIEPERWDVKPRPAAGKCWKAGVCLCRGAGRRRFSISKNFGAALKGFCQAAPGARADVGQARVFFLLVGDRDWGPAGELLQQSRPPEVSRWFHIADQCFSPWESLFMEVQGPCDLEVDFADGRLDGVGIVDLRAMLKEFTYHGMFATLDLQLRWRVVFFTARATWEVVGELRPDWVSVSVAQDGAAHCIWDPRVLLRGHRPEVDRGWCDLADAVEVGSDEDPDDGGEDGEAVDFDGFPAEDVEEMFCSDQGESECPGDADPDGSMLLGDSAPEVSEAALAAFLAPAAAELAGGASAVAAGAGPGDGHLAPGPRGLEADGDRVAWHCPAGSIVWYKSHNDFYARCDDPRHRGGGPACRKVRTAAPGTKAGQGRPCGWLAAWLLGHMEYEDREAHFRLCDPDLEMRLYARGVLQASEAGRLLLACERPKADDESSEPEVLA